MEDRDLIDALVINGVDGWNIDDVIKAKDVVDRYFAELGEQALSIKGQIAQAKEDVALVGKYADADWWRRVNGADRAVGYWRQRCQTAIGLLNKVIRQYRAQTVANDPARRFVSAAKRLLPEATYLAIWTEANPPTLTPPPSKDDNAPSAH
jgi:hypothetical protein